MDTNVLTLIVSVAGSFVLLGVCFFLSRDRGSKKHDRQVGNDEEKLQTP